MDKTKDSKIKGLVIVESPTKARTVGRFLGKGYDVKASMGHVRDLPKKSFGVDIEKDFTPTYEPTPKKGSIVKEISEAAKKAENIYLATDPDREGEAISWHLVESAGLSKLTNLKRVVFHEITKHAIDEAFSTPREIDMDLVNAQQARRVLDRIVGYDISPILWRKVRRGLSAGRVQSVALRLIVDREHEIEAFKPEEFWVISADLTVDGNLFTAIFHALPGKTTKAKVPDKKTSDKIVEALRTAYYSVASVTEKELQQKPQQPFITSTLQQEAARRFRFSAERTMRIAQGLYEGVDIGDGQPAGLITYMRTDSVTLSNTALNQAHSFILGEYGADYTDGPRRYRTKSRNAQEAHEAIRPTDIAKTAESLQPHLTNEQWRLYDLIWKRTVASQMKNAILESTTVKISAKSKIDNEVYTLQANGSVVKFDGFRKLYIEASDDPKENDKSILPAMKQDDILQLVKDGVKAKQRFTQPPPRYSEAMLIKMLEKEGIGRPSTYASIVGTIEAREYVLRDNNRFKPTKLGQVVCEFLVENFPEIMDISFTAEMEERLDAIAEGNLEWVIMLREFHTPFAERIGSAKNSPRVPSDRLTEATTEVCEKCERPMRILHGKHGKFLGCSGYPECRNTKPLTIGVACPSCKDGELSEKRNKKGRPFYGCNRYPECDFIAPRLPMKTPCPDCGGLVIESGTRGKVQCINESCKRSGTKSEMGAEQEEAKSA